MEKLVKIETPLTRLVATWKAARELHEMNPTPENLEAMRIYSRQLLSMYSQPFIDKARAVFAEDGTVDCCHENVVALTETIAYMEFWGNG